MANERNFGKEAPLAEVLKSSSKQAKNLPLVKRPNYNQIHALPLPLFIHQLPPLIPHNPLSLLYVAYVYLKQAILVPSSIPLPRYEGHFSSDTQSVHVSDQRSVRGLWEHGSFGVGNLSRTEPTWLEREKSRRGLSAEETAEEYTQRRRAERKAMKQERARQERLVIEETMKLEEGQQIIKIAAQTTDAKSTFHINGTAVLVEQHGTMPSVERKDHPLLGADIKNEEHLQLPLHEAFFLACVLGVLDIKEQGTDTTIPLHKLLPLFMAHSHIPAAIDVPKTLCEPDNSFLVSYVAYHHFRSLGWVVKSGNKFSVDFLLYNRGPAISHSTFAVRVVPSYEHEYWLDKGKDVENPWHLIFMTNRVQTSVRKKFIICCVDIPPPSDEQLAIGANVEAILKKYRVRELVYSRWSPNRDRA